MCNEPTVESKWAEDESAIIVNDGKKVQLTLHNGDKILVNLEQYIANEIRDYCWNG